MHAPRATCVEVSEANGVIVDGVELPSLLPLAKAAEVLGVSPADVVKWIEQGELQSARLNGVTHVLSKSFADRLGRKTPSRHNQDTT